MKWFLFILVLLFAAPAMAVDDDNFNSAECPHSGGTPTNSDHLMCDDFDDGTWAVTCGGGSIQDCCVLDVVCNPEAPVSPGEFYGDNYGPNDGWTMEDNGPLDWPADDPDPDKNDRTICGGAGFGGTDCAAFSSLIENAPPDSGNSSDPRCYDGGCNGPGDTCLCASRGEMGHNDLLSAVNELYVRWYFKAEAAAGEDDYLYGFVKIMTLQGTGVTQNLMILKFEDESTAGVQAGDGIIKISDYTGGGSPVTRSQNTPSPGGPPLLIRGEEDGVTSGNWYFIEWHVDLGTGGADGQIEMWIDDCGASADQCTGTPTRRMNHTGLSLDGATNEFNELWVENWSNWGAHGVHSIDQIVVSKSPIGFMEAASSSASLSGGSISGGSLQ